MKNPIFSFSVRAQLLGLCLSLLMLPSAFATDLMVTPTRIVFGERDRSAEVHLVNRGTQPATFRIEFVQMRMDETGAMVEIDAPNEKELFADQLVRYSPRQVALAPGEGQSVRLLLRKPEGLAAGEYRSHLLFYALPDADAGNDIEREAAGDPNAFSVQIRAIYRISIPVIVRHGELPADFTISELSVERASVAETLPTLRLRVDRDGRRSVYGDIDVYYRDAQGGAAQLIHHSKDFVLYTSTDTRVFETALNIPGGLLKKGGEVHAVYSEAADGGRRVLAERRIVLP